jgi:hypothetical protein
MCAGMYVPVYECMYVFMYAAKFVETDTAVEDREKKLHGSTWVSLSE